MALAPTNGPTSRLDIAELESLPPEQQAAALAAPGAVRRLADNGQAPPTIALIGKLAPDEQADVLDAPHAMRGLRDAGQWAAV
jgi:hypothetical protein